MCDHSGSDGVVHWYDGKVVKVIARLWVYDTDKKQVQMKVIDQELLMIVDIRDASVNT